MGIEYQIEPFTNKCIESAANIFLSNYKHEQAANSLLPTHIFNDPDCIKSALDEFAANPGVAIFSDGEMVAFMVTGHTFSFKGQKTAMVPEYCHGAIKKDARKLYQLAYMVLSSNWIKDNINLHLIGHFANDCRLKETLFQMGFGAIISERLRDIIPIETNCDSEIRQENDISKLLDIELEHRNYYQAAPIFITKDTGLDSIMASFEESKSDGDVFFVYYENNQLAGYFTVGNSAKDGEGFLLRNTNTAQIKNAFVRPSLRNRGLGRCILNRSILWAKENGFERLFVEHETANFYGGNFWEKHFNPYLYYSMRYIDNSIGK